MFFNAGLAIVNAHIAPLQPTAVVVSEAFVLIAAHILILTNARGSMVPLRWYTCCCCRLQRLASCVLLPLVAWRQCMCAIWP